MDGIVILIIGLLAGGGLTYLSLKSRNRTHIKEEATVLLERVQKVCKLVTVESEFNEILDHKEKSSTFFKLIPQEKKAIIIVKAKVMIGFDLSRASFEINSRQKKLTISHIPDPEVISIEPEVKYYDISNKVFSKFSADDYTSLNKAAIDKIKHVVEKHHIKDKAIDEGFEILEVVQEITSALGWSFKIDGKKYLPKEKAEVP